MTDQTMTLDPKNPTPEEFPMVVQQYQQWLADRDYNIAALNVKYATAAGKLEIANQKNAALEEEVALLRQSSTMTVVDAPDDFGQPSDEPA